MRCFVQALALLTRFPLPDRPAPEAREAAAATAWFPLAGALVGAVSALVYIAAGRNFEPVAASVLAVLAGVLATGGLHLDGLADTADGLACGGAREQRLAVMRDPRVGAMGALAATGSLLLKIAFVSELDPAVAPAALVLAAGLGRWGMVLVMPRYPYARPEPGLGRAYAEHTGPRHVATATLLLIPLLGIVWVRSGVSVALAPVLLPAAALAVAALTALAVAAFFARRLGGLTGDTYGAVNEVVEVLVLGLVAAV